MPSLRYFDGVQYGNIDGLTVLVDPSDNSLYVTQPAVVKLLGWDNLDGTGVRQKFNSKEFKRFLGDCKTSQAESPEPATGKALAGVKSYKGIDSLGRENTVKAIPFSVALAMIHWVAFEGKGQPQANARALIMAGFADSFSSIVLEQCGIKLSLDERQQTITGYLEGYHAFQDWVRDTYAMVYGCKPNNAYYKAIAVTINQFLFNRDHFYRNRLINAHTTELRRLENFQIAFMDTKLACTQDDPARLVNEYIRRLDC
jgi:hypothetical protein